MENSSNKKMIIVCASQQIAQQRIEADYNERYASLLKDGYVLRHYTRLPTSWIARLHHMANGNDILLSADFRANVIWQRTNRILVHYCTYPVDDTMCQS